MVSLHGVALIHIFFAVFKYTPSIMKHIETILAKHIYNGKGATKMMQTFCTGA